jgi:hypothetical protein
MFWITGNITAYVGPNLRLDKRKHGSWYYFFENSPHMQTDNAGKQ